MAEDSAWHWADEPSPASPPRPLNPKVARHVDHLSHIQLYKKRATDRDNQRRTRAKRQNRIGVLEEENATLRDRIKFLESQSPPVSPSFHGRPEIWQVLPKWVDPIGRLDNVMFYLEENCQRETSFRDILTEITKPTYPSVASLLIPSTAVDDPLTSLIGEHGLWMDITSSAARTAMLCNICLYIRYILNPTEENYLALPNYLRPTLTQLLIPHPRCLDVVPWPQAREQLINELDWHKDFETYRTIHNNTVSVNWDDDLCEILTTDDQGTVILSPAFEAHIRKIENWSVGEELAATLSCTTSFPTHPKRNSQVYVVND